MNLYTLTYDENADFCAIYDTPREMEQSHRFSSGMRVGELHDASTSFNMAREVPGKQVPDLIRRVIGSFIVSRRAAEILQRVVNTEAEYLPTSLLNHRKKVATRDLIIVNVIGYYDCVDRTRTEGHRTGDLDAHERRTAQKKGLPRREYDNNDFPNYEYVKITRLFLHPDRTPMDANLFRLSSYITALVFREDVVASLMEAKVTGATFVPLGQPVEI